MPDGNIKDRKLQRELHITPKLAGPSHGARSEWDIADVRRARPSLLHRTLRRPELGSLVVAIAVFTGFAIYAPDSGFLSAIGIAGYLNVSAQLGVIAVPVGLLMVAGEFDLSVGSMIAAAGMLLAVLNVQFGLPVWLAAVITFVFAGLYGLLNGLLVTKTRLPSFIVTLAGLFALQGASIGVPRAFTGLTQIGNVGTSQQGDPLHHFFTASIGYFPIIIIWWVVILAVASVVLQRSRFGNWIFATGGHISAARSAGVPVGRVKVVLFITTALAACFVGVTQVLVAGSANASQGTQVELQAIIAAVVGGTLMSGGYGSAVGPALGALTFGMVEQGIFYAGINSDWFYDFLGLMLLLAVFGNDRIRSHVLNLKAGKSAKSGASAKS